GIRTGIRRYVTVFPPVPLSRPQHRISNTERRTPNAALSAALEFCGDIWRLGDGPCSRALQTNPAPSVDAPDPRGDIGALFSAIGALFSAIGALFSVVQRYSAVCGGSILAFPGAGAAKCAVAPNPMAAKR